MLEARPVTVQLLGGFSVRSGEDWVRLPGPAARVLALLALNGGLGRDAAGSELWPDAQPGQSLAYLRNALWRLNAAVTGVVVNAGALIQLKKSVVVDARGLLDWAASMVPDSDSPQGLPLPHVVGRQLLPGWDDPWLDDYREQLGVLVPEALEAFANARLRNGSMADCLWYALHAHQLDPLRESAVRIIVEVHLRQGNRVAALQAFDRYRRLLLSELGIEPTPALIGLLGGTSSPWSGPRPAVAQAVRSPAKTPRAARQNVLAGRGKDELVDAAAESAPARAQHTRR